jgi:predicted RNA-binding Zn-ribbon protein involved in translation (DUF1610 family)
LNIKVECKKCNWEGRAVVGRKGSPLRKYYCPKCGHDIKRGKGTYNLHGEKAKLKRVINKGIITYQD